MSAEVPESGIAFSHTPFVFFQLPPSSSELPSSAGMEPLPRGGVPIVNVLCPVEKPFLSLSE
jgi:hypothetical protein